LAKWGGALGWAGLHAVGGAIGGSIGIVLITSLAVRGVQRIDVKKQMACESRFALRALRDMLHLPILST